MLASSLSVGVLIKIPRNFDCTRGIKTYRDFSISPFISKEFMNIGKARLVSAAMASSNSLLLYFTELWFDESLCQSTLEMPCFPEQFPQQSVTALSSTKGTVSRLVALTKGGSIIFADDKVFEHRHVSIVYDKQRGKTQAISINDRPDYLTDYSS